MGLSNYCPSVCLIATTFVYDFLILALKLLYFSSGWVLSVYLSSGLGNLYGISSSFSTRSFPLNIFFGAKTNFFDTNSDVIFSTDCFTSSKDRLIISFLIIPLFLIYPSVSEILKIVRRSFLNLSISFRYSAINAICSYCNCTSFYLFSLSIISSCGWIGFSTSA